MNINKKNSLHYLALAGVILLGTILRFWNLDLKPLWLDEVLTALLSLGGRYEDVPLDVLLPISTFLHIFAQKSSVSCPEIAQAVATQSTHPPLFFCLMHQWLNWLEPVAQPLSWKLRSLPALLGVCQIALIYYLNRIIFSANAGLITATLMAVSPFGVYLSQEARHYTLPMVFITLALLGLIKIQQSLYSQKLPQPLTWLLWGIVNSIGCYIHYFFFLAFIAQLLTLTWSMYWRRRMLPRGSWIAVVLVIIGVAVSYLPWLPVMLGGFGRSETRWLPKPENIAPLYQSFAGWLSVVVALPVEGQPLLVQIPVVLLMIIFGIWVVWQAWLGFKQLWQQPSTHIAIFSLAGFIFGVLLQFTAIIYLLGKDITVAPRYNFVYYPAMCALLGISLAFRTRKERWRYILPFGISLLSCIFVVANLVFLKPFHPQQVALDISREPDIPITMVMGYSTFQDVALGLSFALAINQKQSKITKEINEPNLAFLNTKLGYDLVWYNLSKLPILPAPRLNLWVMAPGLKQRNYPPQLKLANQNSCLLDPNGYHRIGIPYQLYRCVSKTQL